MAFKELDVEGLFQALEKELGADIAKVIRDEDMSGEDFINLTEDKLASMVSKVEQKQKVLRLIAAETARTTEDGACTLNNQAEEEIVPVSRSYTAALQPREMLSKYFLEAFSSNPNKPILITSNNIFTFNWLESNASRTQFVLRNVGVQQSQVVAIFMPRGPNLMASVFGCTLHGAVFLLLDPTLPKQRLKLMLEVAKPAVVLCSMDTHEQTTGLSVTALLLDFEVNEGHFTSKLRNVAIEEIPTETKVTETFTCCEDTLYIIFTSGSTGSPKGVCASAAGTLSRFEWMWAEYPFHCWDVICFKTAIGFVDCISEVFGAILKAVPLVIASDDEVKDPRLLLSIIEKNSISRITFVPSYLDNLLNCSSALKQLETLRICASGGEYLTMNLASKFLSSLPNCKLLNLYGSSEVCADVTCFEVTQEYLNQTNHVLVPIGKPIANVSVTVNQGNQMINTVSEPGELIIYGDCVAHSYLNSSVSTLFQVDGKTRGFKTGDIVHYVDSGDIMYVGRSDDIIKVRGIRINPAEIEALLEEHGLVEKAVVLPDEHSMSLLAFVKITGSIESCSAAPTAVRHADIDYFYDPALSETVTAHAMSVLPQQQVPSCFVFSYSLPLLHSGKVNRSHLPDSSVIHQVYAAGMQQHSGTNSDTEEQLCSIFMDCIGLLDCTCAPPSSTFISLGGNSLLAVEAACRLEDHFSCSVPVSTVLSATIGELARFIESQQVERQAQFDTMNVDITNHTDTQYGISEGPLSFQQEAMWVAQEIWNEDAMVVEIAALFSQQPIQSECLRKVIQQLTVNHDCLRTIFQCDSNGRPFQKVPRADCPELHVQCSFLTVIDCSKQTCPASFENGLIHLPKFNFNLTEGPLWRFLLFSNVRWPGSCHERDLLALQIHHIITDGWSLRILFKELENRYDQMVSSECSIAEQSASSMSSPLIQCALMQRNEVGSDPNTEAKLKYWETTLQNASQYPFLDPDRHFSTDFCDGHTLLREFDMPLLKVRQFCQSNGISEFVLVFTGLLIANYALSGSEDLAVLLAVSNRTPANATVTGPLSSLKPLRTAIKHGTSLQLLLNCVRNAVLDLFHNALPLEYVEKHLMRTGKILQEATTLPTEYPFDQIMFVYDQEESIEVSGSNMFQMIPVFTHHPETALDIYASMPRGMNKLCVKLVYEVGPYNPGKLSTLLESWGTVLQALLDDPPMDETVLQFCENLSTMKMSVDFNFSAELVGKSLNSPEMAMGSGNNPAIMSSDDWMSWDQLDVMQKSMSSKLALVSDLQRPPKVAILFPFSVLAMATATAAVKCGCSFHFTSLAGCEGMVEEDRPDIVVGSSEDMDDVHDFVIGWTGISSATVVSAQSLLTQELPRSLGLKSLDCTAGIEATGDSVPTGGRESLHGGSTQACTEGGGHVLTKIWQRDFTTCLQIIDNYFPELSIAAVLTCPESPTFPIAISLLLRGVSLCILSRDDLNDTCSFAKLLEKHNVQLLVVPEVISATISCQVDFSCCKQLSHIWVHGMPFGLAHLSLVTARNVLPEVIVTHSLVPEKCLITHHFKLQESAVAEAIEAKDAYLLLGVVCQGLAWKISHRDGRSVQPGFAGEFTVAAEDGNTVHHSGMLVRQLVEDGSFELVAFNVDTYYSGQDVTLAVNVLSKVPEVVWCHAEMDFTQGSVHCWYTVMKISKHAKDSLEAIALHRDISSKLMPYMSQTFLTRCLFQVPAPPPITDKLSLDHKELQLLTEPTATQLVQSDPMKTKSDVVKRVAAVVSKVFEVGMEEAESCTDLVAIGSMSLSLLLDLTVEVNKEFNATLTVSDVASACRNVQQLCHLVS